MRLWGAVYTPWIRPSADDLGSASLRFVPPETRGIKRGQATCFHFPRPPSPSPIPAMATPDVKLADVEKTSSRSPSVVADEAYVDPKGNETLHRGLNARQVRPALPPVIRHVQCSPSPQISMISLGGAVGTGLIIGSGTALVR